MLTKILIITNEIYQVNIIYNNIMFHNLFTNVMA